MWRCVDLSVIAMQGASWSSMDFGGNWRLLHYTMKKTYAPFLIVASSQDDSCEIWAISDISEPVSGTCEFNSKSDRTVCLTRA